jgi:toxin FitB
MEIWFGLRIMPAGQKQTLLTKATDVLLQDTIQGRIAGFDVAAAEHAAELMARRKAAGRMMDSRDTMIAGIALATRATLATRNTSHFSDLSVPVVNPWTS